jgi:hypothetical protein
MYACVYVSKYVSVCVCVCVCVSQAEFAIKLFRSSWLTVSSILGAFYFGQVDFHTCWCVCARAFYFGLKRQWYAGAK